MHKIDPINIYLFKVNNGNSRTMFGQNQWHRSGFIYCQLSSDFTHCSDVSIADFEQLNAGWRTKQSSKQIFRLSSNI